VQNVLKGLVTLFLITTLYNAVSDYRFLIALISVEVGFWFQYIGHAGILGYFVSAMVSFYGGFSHKKWCFISIYSYILLATLYGKTCILFPTYLFPPNFKGIYVFVFNLLCIFCIIWLHGLSIRHLHSKKPSTSIG
jgi:hypothetical protein